MQLGGGALRNTAAVLISVASSLGTVGTQMGFEINEPTTFICSFIS